MPAASKSPQGAKLYDFTKCPSEMKNFLYYLVTIRNLSVNTVNAYFLDLRTFFRYIVLQSEKLDLSEISFEEIDISSVSLADIEAVTSSTLYDYLFFITKELNNSPKTRARKLSAVKTFFKYLTVKAHLLQDDPSKNIEIPSLKKSLPKYLSLEESMELLNSVETDFPERDYCILTLFLNCGMRLSELVGIDLRDYSENTIRILGKGNKERLVYLNESCVYALQNYIEARRKLKNLKDEQALFVSARRGTRLTGRRVEQIVSGCLASAGLSGRGYSPHKLRHTAATLMYRFGNVDMLALKEILGHEHVTTTEIYTHISTEQLMNAASSSPLSGVKLPMGGKKKKQEDALEQDTGSNADAGAQKLPDLQLTKK